MTSINMEERTVIMFTNTVITSWVSFLYNLDVLKETFSFPHAKTRKDKESLSQHLIFLETWFYKNPSDEFLLEMKTNTEFHDEQHLSTKLRRRILQESKCWGSKVKIMKNAVMTGFVSLVKDIQT